MNLLERVRGTPPAGRGASASLLLLLASCTSPSNHGTAPNGGDEDTGPPAIACSVDADCPGREICSTGSAGGTCAPRCLVDDECPRTDVCLKDYGCWPEGTDPPGHEPPHDLTLDYDNEVYPNVTWVGCKLDFDCATGRECVSGQCVAVDAGASCSLPPSGDMTVREIVGPIAANALSPGYVPVSAAAGVLPNGTAILTLMRIDEGRMRTFITELAQDYGVVTGVFENDGAYDVYLGTGGDRTHLRLDENATVLGPGGTAGPSLNYEAGTVLWDRRFEHHTYIGWDYWSKAVSYFRPSSNTGSAAPPGATDQGVCGMVSGDGLVSTTTGAGGVYDHRPGKSGELIVIDPDHRGVAVHNRTGEEYGWFSADSQGALYYWIGTLDGKWTMEAVPVPASFATFRNPGNCERSLQPNPVTGEPHFSVGHINGNLYSIVRSPTGNWSILRAAINTWGMVDVVAGWAGCSKPVVQFIEEVDRGWYVAEAQ